MAELYLKRQKGKKKKTTHNQLTLLWLKFQYSILNTQAVVYKTMNTCLKSAGNSINVKSDGRKNQNKYFTFLLAIK